MERRYFLLSIVYYEIKIVNGHTCQPTLACFNYANGASQKPLLNPRFQLGHSAVMIGGTLNRKDDLDTAMLIGLYGNWGESIKKTLVCSIFLLLPRRSTRLVQNVLNLFVRNFGAWKAEWWASGFDKGFASKLHQTLWRDINILFCTYFGHNLIYSA